MRTHIFPLTATMLPAIAGATPARSALNNPGNEPLMDSKFNFIAGNQLGTCSAYFGPLEPNHPGKQLNQMWQHVWQMLNTARRMMSGHPDVGSGSRLLQKGFFAIDDKTLLDAASQQRQSFVTARLADMDRLVFRRTRKSASRPLFLCDSEWLTYVSLDGMVRVAEHGRPELVTGEYQKGAMNLRHYLTIKQKIGQPDDRWWFYASLPQLKQPILSLSKHKDPPIKGGQPPWFRDPARGRRFDPCYKQTTGAFVMYGQTDTGVLPILTICPNAMSSFPAADGRLNTTAQAGMRLDDSESTQTRLPAQTLFRLLLEFSDVEFKLGRTPVRWPKDVSEIHKPDFSKFNFLIFTNKTASTTIDVQWLLRYDLSAPASSFDEQGSAIYNLDRYAWFALAAYMTAETHFDWSNGEAKALHDPTDPYLERFGKMDWDLEVESKFP